MFPTKVVEKVKTSLHVQ